jgi:hypothetical protein
MVTSVGRAGTTLEHSAVARALPTLERRAGPASAVAGTWYAARVCEDIMVKTKLPPDLHPRRLPESPEAAVREANEEIERASQNKLELPVTVLIRQRDTALEDAWSARYHSEQELADVRREQDQFVSSLMREHEVRMAEMEACHVRDLSQLRQQLVALSRKAPTEPGLEAVNHGGASQKEAILREQLSEALVALQSTRAESEELREELDAAARAYDVMRQEMWDAVVEARDETSAQKLAADELVRALEAEKAARAEEGRELQAELGRLRAELQNRQVLPSDPALAVTVPPELSAALGEAAQAKNEAHSLRMELIDTKRTLNRASQELQAVSTELRRSRRSTQAMPKAQSPAALEQRGAQAAELPAFQRFMQRRERILGTYSDGGGIDVVDPVSEPPASSKRP